ncbi:MAG TPA: radical SAM protein, partial [Hanamia sp.]|nr:radical SAM protein [Hanamia sp.]
MDNKQLKQDHFKVAPQQKEEEQQYLNGRGAQFNTKNRFLKNYQEKEEIESIDDWEEANVGTQYIEQEVKSIVNKVESPDLSMMYS